MNKTIHAIVLIVCCFITPRGTEAAWGQGCCCPSASGCIICGIVPCDEGCAGTAFRTMGTTNVSSINSVNSEFTRRISELTDLALEFATLGADVVLEVTEQTMSPLESGTIAWSQFGSRVAFEVQRNTKASENLIDHLVNELSAAYKQQAVAKEKDMLEKEFGDISQPVSGDIGADRTMAWAKANVEREELLLDYAKVAHEYNKAQNLEEGGFLNYLSRLMGADETEEQLQQMHRVSGFTKSQSLSEEEYKALSKTILKIVNPLPQAYPGSDSDSGKTVKKRMVELKAQAIQMALYKQMLNRTQLVEAEDWNVGYADVNKPGDKGKLSIYDIYTAEVDGRHQKKGWHENLMQLTATGLIRELAHMEAISNKLYTEILNRKSDELHMQSMTVATSLNRARP